MSELCGNRHDEQRVFGETVAFICNLPTEHDGDHGVRAYVTLTRANGTEMSAELDPVTWPQSDA